LRQYQQHHKQDDKADPEIYCQNFAVFTGTNIQGIGVGDASSMDYNIDSNNKNKNKNNRMNVDAFIRSEHIGILSTNIKIE